MANENPMFLALAVEKDGRQLAIRWDHLDVIEILPMVEAESNSNGEGVATERAILRFAGGTALEINDPEVLASFLITVGLRQPTSSLIEVPDIGIGNKAVKRHLN